MRSVAILSALLLLAGGPVMAQSNATVKGTQTAPSNGQGTPNAGTPAGQVSTTTTSSTGPAASPTTK